MKKLSIEEFKVLFNKEFTDSFEVAFFGREKQLAIFENFYKEKNILGIHFGVHGTRRTGKTTLIRHFIDQKLSELKKAGKSSFYYSITGDFNRKTNENGNLAITSLGMSLEEKLSAKSFRKWEKISKKLEKENLKVWRRFFMLLVEGIRLIKEECEAHCFVFFDEVAWFSKDESFISEYGYYLNESSVNYSGVMNFLACSSNSWMRSKIFKDTKGLFNRFVKMEVPQFSFQEIFEYFQLKGWQSDKNEVLKYYLIFGGFIKYYKDLSEDINFATANFETNIQKINQLKWYFREEYESFFRGIFSEKRPYKEIVELILKNRTPLEEELIEEVQRTQRISTKTVKELILELNRSGIISQSEVLNRRNYYCELPLLYFFHYFLLENTNRLENEAIHKWKGEMFEILAFKTVSEIILHLTKNKAESFLNFLVRAKDIEPVDSEEIIAQFDIVVEEKNQNRNLNRARKFYLIEVKFQDNPISAMQRQKLSHRAVLFKLFIEQNRSQKETGKVYVYPLFFTNQKGNGTDIFNVLNYLS